MLSIYANDPDLLKNEPTEQVGALQQAVSFSVRPFRELISRNETNWAVIAAAARGLGRESVSDRCPKNSGSRASGRKSAASAGWIVPIRWRRGTPISKGWPRTPMP